MPKKSKQPTVPISALVFQSPTFGKPQTVGGNFEDTTRNDKKLARGVIHTHFN